MFKNEYISDYELVNRLQKRDVEAFDLIFERYGNKLFGFALKYLKSKKETEEFIQDVFLKIWENKKKLKKESSLKAYLFTIAYHDMCRIFRKRQIYLKYIEEIGKTEKLTNDPGEQLQYKSMLWQIDKLIEKLPEKQRIIFIKSRKEGKSTREIAKEMNMAPGTVDNYISAALKFIRKKISMEDFAFLMFFTVFIL